MLAFVMALALAWPAPAAAPAPTPSPTPSPEKILAGLQSRYDALATLRLRFHERYESRATSHSIEENGSLTVARPGRMRWEYREPEPKLFVLAAGTAWFYVPEDGVAYRMPIGEQSGRNLPALFLAGQGNFTRDFTASIETGAPGLRLRLVPRQAGEDYDFLLIDLEPRSLALKALSVVDPIGNVTEYRFSDEEPNVAVPDSAFRFAPPPGVEVVETHGPPAAP